MNKSMNTTIASVSVLVAGVAAPAVAQPDHIFLTIEDGSVRSNLWVDTIPGQDGPGDASGGDITPGIRAFSQQLGGVPGFGPTDPGQSIHPGIFGDLPGGTVIGFDIIDAARVWDGSDFDEVSGDDAGEQRLQVAGFTTPTGNPLSPDVFLTPDLPGDDQWLTINGEIDEHLQFVLTDDAGAVLDAAQLQAISGIYLLTMQWTSPGLDSTDPVFITFGHNVTDGELAEAQRFVQDVLVPAPGTLGVLAGLGLVGARRRR